MEVFWNRNQLHELSSVVGPFYPTVHCQSELDGLHSHNDNHDGDDHDDHRGDNHGDYDYYTMT